MALCRMQGRHTCLPSPPGRVRTCRFAMQNAALRSTAAAATPKRADSRSAEGAFGSFPHVVAGAAGARHAAAAGADLHAGLHAGLEDHAVVNRQTLGTALNSELVPCMDSNEATHEDRISIEKPFVENGRAT